MSRSLNALVGMEEIVINFTYSNEIVLLLIFSNQIKIFNGWRTNMIGIGSRRLGSVRGMV